MSIRRTIAAWTEVRRRRQQLAVVGLTNRDILDLIDANLDPFGIDFEMVVEAAKLGTAPSNIPAHLAAAHRLVMDQRWHLDDAIYHVARIANLFGCRHDVAAYVLSQYVPKERHQ